MKIIRKKPKIDETMEKIKNYFHLKDGEIRPELLDVYSIDIKNNEEAQKIYKQRNPFGNTDRPGFYDFTKEILVRWDDYEKKPQIL